MSEAWHTHILTLPNECPVCIYREARPDDYVRLMIGPKFITRSLLSPLSDPDDN